MEEIREWLESGQDYAQGVALYAQHGRSAVLRSTLAYGETEFTRGKLVHALQQLLAGAPAVARPAVVVPAPPPAAAAAPVAGVDPQRRTWYAERNHLHPQLEGAGSDAARLAMALRILELGDAISQSYQVPAPGAAPAGPTTPGLAAITDEGRIRKLLANLKPQRTKLKTKPHRAADLARVEADIHLLETKLKP